jgi:hypothetical protein
MQNNLEMKTVKEISHQDANAPNQITEPLL